MWCTFFPVKPEDEDHVHKQLVDKNCNEIILENGKGREIADSDIEEERGDVLDELENTEGRDLIVELETANSLSEHLSCTVLEAHREAHNEGDREIKFVHGSEPYTTTN